MERDCYKKLLSWKNSPLRKPLVLRGARQVGKTYLLTEFAKREYSEYIYVNFEENPIFATLFEENLDPDRLINVLEIYFKRKINPSDTFIIFDEIQECPKALTSLKYFCEKKNEYHIAAAGSLLGVKLTQGFPVGQVNFLDLAPLSFFEFLDAIGETELRKMISSLTSPKPLLELFHKKLLSILKFYFVVGGMPEAVVAYLKTDSLERVREIQKEILDAYVLDFAKHAPKNDVMKIMSLWEAIPNQLAKENKKFVFSAISKSARARDFEASLQWLQSAGLIIRTNRITTPKLPLDAYSDKQAFKVFLLDIGLLGALSKLDPRTILEGDQLFQEFKGSLTENYVATELYDQHFEQLYYWTNDASAEVDFIVTNDRQIYPLEVKAGVSSKKKSLLVYRDKYLKEESSSVSISRATLMNFAFDGGLVNYPLYAVSLFPRLSRK